MHIDSFENYWSLNTKTGEGSDKEPKITDENGKKYSPKILVGFLLGRISAIMPNGQDCSHYREQDCKSY